MAQGSSPLPTPQPIHPTNPPPSLQGQWYRIFDLPDPQHVNQMSELDPKRHIAKNKNVMAGYSLSSLLRSESHIDSVLLLMSRRFDGLIAASKPMDPPVWFNFMAFDILGEMIFSKSFGFLRVGYDIGGAIANTSQLAIYISIMGHLQWLHRILLGNPLIGILGLQPNQHIFDTTMATIAERKANPEIRRDMVEQWTERYESVKEKPGVMEEKEILCAAIANVGAGADTVSATMQAVFHYLIRAPEWYGKVKGEIDAAFDRGELGTVTSVPAYADTQKLPILQACVSGGVLLLVKGLMLICLRRFAKRIVCTPPSASDFPASSPLAAPSFAAATSPPGSLSPSPSGRSTVTRTFSARTAICTTPAAG